ncbi:MAG: Clp protease ClpS [Ignavibacteria bacterium GWA2_35_9]|nr:MAG: Clp protease ClpS [Ignavibacteria bacterium GWA2_35_9]OGU48824.1 MAG: Clp protease ClpS [Ignavibacteria bacterium GWB2_36_8]
MEQISEQKPSIDILEEEKVTTGIENRVILYNDDWHTFEEVIVQLIKATKCSFDQARSYAFEVHVKGKAIVFNGSIKDCLKVSSVLEEIALNTQIVS